MDNFEAANSARCSAEIIALRGPRPVQDPAWAHRNLKPDLPGDPRSAAWLADMAALIGANIAKVGSYEIECRIRPLHDPARPSAFRHTYAVACCLNAGGKVRALEFLADVAPSDRAFFMVRLADAMGEATRGREHQL